MGISFILIGINIILILQLVLICSLKKEVNLIFRILIYLFEEKFKEIECVLKKEKEDGQ